MTTKLKLERSMEGIATVKEMWLDEITRPEEAERENQRIAQEYARRLAELSERREAQINAIREHARKLGELAFHLQQQAEERAHEEARAKEIDPALEEEFRALADKWRRETRLLSSDSDIAANFAYHQIIGMGEKALPLIFREMQERGGRWFWALRAITRKNPVKPEDRGNVRKMIQAWLEWGKQHKYV